MRLPSALVDALRLLILGLLMCGIVLKPSLAIAEELHELIAHATVVGDGHTHVDAHEATTAPVQLPDGPAPHDDSHFHLTHCCGQQAAVLPRVVLALVAPHADAPLPIQAIAFVPAKYTAPFRPPIVA